MRALVLSRVTEAHGPGGMQRHLSLLLEWLGGAGVDVTLLTTSGGALPSRPGLHCLTVAATKPGRYSRAWWRGSRRIVRDQPGAWDVIVSEDGAAWAVIDELRRVPSRPPIVMFRHGTTLLNFRQLLPPRRLRDLASVAGALRDYWRHPHRLARTVDLMIAPTDRIAASARVEAAGSEAPICVIHLGVDLARFRPTTDRRADRASLGLDPEVPVLSWVGRDVSGKRLDLALAVVERLALEGQPVQLAVAVARPRDETLARIDAARTRSRARIAIFADATADQVVTIHRAASCQLFSSRLAEGVPFAILESLACGTPVFATNSSSVRDLDVFREEPAWLVPSDRIDDWTSKARSMLTDTAEPALGYRARDLTQRHYDLADTARRSIAAVLDVVGARHTPRSA